MNKINLDHLLSVLEELPREKWREEQENNLYQFCTQVDCTKINRPGERDIPGFYGIILEHEIPPEQVNGGAFKLKVFKEEKLVLSESGRTIQKLYDRINLKLNLRRNYHEIKNTLP